MVDRAPSYVAECFWPDVAESDLAELDARVREATASALDAGGVRYLGSILLCEDEVVLCEFQGPAGAVRDLAERARIPFERILEAARSPWSPARING